MKRSQWRGLRQNDDFQQDEVSARAADANILYRRSILPQPCFFMAPAINALSLIFQSILFIISLLLFCCLFI